MSRARCCRSSSVNSFQARIDFPEGGVRVPAFAWWPGVIEPGQLVGDIIYEVDMEDLPFDVFEFMEYELPWEMRSDPDIGN
jgi:hypothetical protein